MKNILYYPGKALELYRDKYQILLILSLIIAAIGLIFDLLNLALPSLLSGPLATILMLVLRLLLLVIFNISLFRIVKNVILDKKSNLLEEIAAAKARYKDYIVLSVVLFIIVFAGTILLIIPGIIFAVWYFASTYLVATEDLKPMNALDLSRKRVEGKFLPVLGRFLISFLVIPLPFIIVISLLATIGSPSSATTDYISIFSNFLYVLLLSPYLYLIIALIYEDLKESKSTSA